MYKTAFLRTFKWLLLSLTALALIGGGLFVAQKSVAKYQSTDLSVSTTDNTANTDANTLSSEMLTESFVTDDQSGNDSSTGQDAAGAQNDADAGSDDDVAEARWRVTAQWGSGSEQPSGCSFRVDTWYQFKRLWTNETRHDGIYTVNIPGENSNHANYWYNLEDFQIKSIYVPSGYYVSSIYCSEGWWLNDFYSKYDVGGNVTLTFYVYKRVYTIWLNTNGGSGGTGAIYEWYGKGYYWDSGCTNAIGRTWGREESWDDGEIWGYNHYYNYGPIGVPSRTGYTFNGYYTATSGGTQRIFNNGYFEGGFNGWEETEYGDYWSGDSGIGYWVYNNATYYAQWTAKTYVCTLNANGGTLSGGTSDKYNVTSTTCQFNVQYDTNWYNGMGTSATRTGYTFDGWWSAASGGTRVWYANGSYVPNSGFYNSSAIWYYDGANPTFYAHWSQDRIAVEFNPNGGTIGVVNTTAISAASSQICILNDRPYRKTNAGSAYYGTIYRVDSETWSGPLLVGTTLDSVHYQAYYNNTWNNCAGSSFTYNGTTYYVSGTGAWFPADYKDTSTTGAAQIVADSVTNAGIRLLRSKIVNSGAQIGTLPTPTRNGYTFVGWFTTSESSGGTQLTTTTTFSGRSCVTYFARWTPATYSINYTMNSGTHSGSYATSYTFSPSSSQAKSIGTASRNGYTGSVSTTKGSISGSTLTIPANTYGNITVTWTWAANTYTVYLSQTAPSGGSTSVTPATTTIIYYKYNTNAYYTNNRWSKN